MAILPMQKLAEALRQHGLVRFFHHYAEMFPTSHLKDLVVDAVGPNRTIVVAGREVVNFGSDSFLSIRNPGEHGRHSRAR